MAKKLIALLLSVLMVVSLFAACNNSADKPADTKPAADDKPADDKPAETPTVPADEDPIELTWVVYGAPSTRNAEFFENEFHDAILEDTNVDLTVEMVPWGERPNSGVRLQAGEQFALYYILPLSPEIEWANQGLLKTLDEELLYETAPAWADSRNGADNSFGYLNGELVNVPFGSKVFSDNSCHIRVRNDILKSVGYDANDIKTLADLDEACKAVQAEYPDLYIGSAARRSTEELLGSDVKGNIQQLLSNNLLYIDEGTDEMKAFSYYESETYKNIANRAAYEREQGFIDENENEYGRYSSGTGLLTYGDMMTLYKHDEATMPEGAEIDLIVMNDRAPIITRNFDWGVALSASCTDEQEVAMYRVLNWIYESKENFLMTTCGVEGKDWDYAEDGSITHHVSDEFLVDVLFTTTDYVDYSAYDAAEVEEFLNWDKKAVDTKLKGFMFDAIPVENEIALCSAVVDEHFKPITQGIVSYEEGYEAALAELKAAGIDKVLEEYNKQLAAFAG